MKQWQKCFAWVFWTTCDNLQKTIHGQKIRWIEIIKHDFNGSVITCLDFKLIPKKINHSYYKSGQGTFLTFTIRNYGLLIRKTSKKDPHLCLFAPSSYLTKVPFLTSQFQHSHFWVVLFWQRGWDILTSQYDQLSIWPLVKLATIIYGNICDMCCKHVTFWITMWQKLVSSSISTFVHLGVPHVINLLHLTWTRVTNKLHLNL
jgi:hypothetical protein